MASTPKPTSKMTATEYAAHAGVVKSRVSTWIGQGMPAEDGSDGQRKIKLIDPGAADAWRAANLRAAVQSNGRVRGLVEDPAATSNTGAQSGAQRIVEAKAREAEISMRMREIALLKAEGKLVDRDAAARVMRDMIGAVGKAIDRMPGNKATVMADSLGASEHDVYRALMVIAEEMRDELARYAASSGERVAALGGGVPVGGPTGRDQAAPQADAA